MNNYAVSVSTRLFVWLSVVMCLAFVGWASVGTLDIVSVAQGEVVPSSLVKRVQHLEGGIVSELLVHEGQVVTAGQELVVLESTQHGSTVEEVKVRIAALEVTAARLAAEAELKSELVFPNEVLQRNPDRVIAAKELFQSRRARLESLIASKHHQVVQKTQAINRIRVRIQKNRDELALLHKELAITEELLRDQLATELKYIQLQREATSLESSIGQDIASLARARSELAEVQEEVNQVEAQFKEKAQDELREVQQELDEFGERLKKFEDTLNRTVLRSPVEGVIKQLGVSVAGEVIEPGGTVLTIVPSADKLVVEAHLPIRDIGYVKMGQRALLSLASNDARRFGKLEGHVSMISPDAFSNNNSDTFYKVRIETENACFSRGENTYCLYPGMIVVCSIHTGERTVLEYLLSPFIGQFSFALVER